MRVAVDVIGTLVGRNRPRIITMILELVKQGHEVVIWSSEYSIAVSAAEVLTTYFNEGLGQPYQFEARSKMMRYDYPEESHFDYAIEDDRRQGYLAAKNFIWVDELPNQFIACEALARSLK